MSLELLDNLRGRRSRGGLARAQLAHPEVLVDTAWVVKHKDDPNVRVVEVDVDTSAYEQGETMTSHPPSTTSTAACQT